MKRGALVCCCALAVPATSALAVEVDWSFSGFATLGLVSTRADHARFVRVGVSSGDERNPGAGVDSVLGLQGNLRIGEHNAAMLQVQTRETPLGNYRPHFALAFISHQLSPEWTVRGGRMRLPFFMVSDSIHINYSHPWVRPPVEVYGLNPFSDLDGVDFLYRTAVRGTDIEIHPYAGSSRIEVLGGGDARLRRLVGVNLSMTHGEWTLSTGHAIARLAVHRDSPSLNALLDRPPTIPPELRARLSGDNTHATFSSIGFQWDNRDWLLSGELARTTAGRYNNSAHGWTLTAGRHFGALMPYLTLSRSRQDKPIFDADLAGRDPRLAFLNRSRNQAQHSVTAGLRWDFAASAALKAEFTRSHTDPDAWGSFFAVGAPFSARMGDRRVHMLSLSIDVVF